MGRVVILDTVCFKNFDEIALSCTVKETEAIWCFALFVTNLKIDNDPHFWRVKNSLKLGKVSLHRSPVDKIFWQNRSVCTVSRYKHFLCFAIFVKNSKWPSFLMGQNWVSYSVELPCGSKILSKSLYVARFLRYKYFCVLDF